ncbi:N-acetylmuramidase [Lactobacillus bombi]|nr:N-acetylmuramidase [Bombilactobacillus bombi]
MMVKNFIRQLTPVAQPPIQVKTIEKQHQEFIQDLAPAAVKYSQVYGGLPSITIAQAILESDWGQSQLASKYHNLFGVKSDDPQNSQVLKTQEYENGSWTTISASFRVYPNFEESIRDHAALLANGTTWNKQQYQHVLASTNYLDAANNLQRDGYATDPDYTQKIIKIIQKYHLDRYDTR